MSIMLSGIMISRAVMPSFGIAAPGNFVWRELHDMSANLFLIILGIHLALHWKWIVAVAKRSLQRKETQPAAIKGMPGKDAQS